MEPIIEKVMARKVDNAPALPSPDYAFPAMPRKMAQSSGNKEFEERLDKVASDRASGVRNPGAGITG